MCEYIHIIDMSKLFHIIGKTGDMLWFKGTYNPMADIDGNLTQVMLMAQFTTHEKKKLDELTTYVKTLSEHTYYIEMNPDYSIRSANKRFLEFKGLSRLQVKKQNLKTLLNGSYHAFETQQVATKLMHGKNAQLSIHMADVGGTVHNFSGHFSPVTDKQKNLNKILLILT